MNVSPLGVVFVLVLLAVQSVVPILVIWAILRYGPIRNRWWRREHPLVFALCIGFGAFAIGFFGPMLWAPDANQGPLLGIFMTGPLGLVVGLIWGWRRAAGRQRTQTESEP